MVDERGVMGRFLIGFTGLLLLLYAGSLVWMSGLIDATRQVGTPRDFVLLFVGATLAISALHIGCCIVAHRQPPRLFYILFIGAVARMILLFGAPGAIYEGDHARMRFDARLMNSGVNPYAYRPADLADNAEHTELREPAERIQIALVRAQLTAGADGPRPEEVGRPDLRATSTPAGIAVGALGDRFKPANTRGYAFLILCADALACFLLLMALRSIEFPLGWIIVYAWSPILLKEAYCTLSIDIFVLPGIAALVYGLVSMRRGMAALGLAISIAIRPATLLLAPVMFRRTGVLAVFAGLLLASATFVPTLLDTSVEPAAVGQGSIHVWRHHEYNSFAENLLRASLRGFDLTSSESLRIAGVEILGPDMPIFDLLAKLICLVALMGIVTYLVIRISDRIEEAKKPGLNDLFITLVALLLLAPVLKPAHTLWLLPVLVVRCYGVAWLALPALTTLSYLTHLVGPMASDFDLPGTPFSYRMLEFGAFGLLLLMDRIAGRSIFPDAVAWEEHLVWQVNAADEDLEAAQASDESTLVTA